MFRRPSKLFRPSRGELCLNQLKLVDTFGGLRQLAISANQTFSPSFVRTLMSSRSGVGYLMSQLIIATCHSCYHTSAPGHQYHLGIPSIHLAFFSRSGAGTSAVLPEGRQREHLARDATTRANHHPSTSHSALEYCWSRCWHNPGIGFHSY